MNTRTFKIAITNPCSNNWDDMDPVSVGRFCHSCQKNVVDFTTKSDSEIKEYLQNRRNEETCGRFYKTQIDLIRIEFDPYIFQSNIKSWQKFLVVLMICFGTDVLGIDFCLAQTNVQDSAFVQIDADTIQTEMVDSLVDSIIEDTNSKPLEEVKTHFIPHIDVSYPWEYMITSGSVRYIPENPLPEINWCSLIVPTIPEEPVLLAEKAKKAPKKPDPVNNGIMLNPTLENPENVPLPDPNDKRNQNLYIFNESETTRKRRKKRKA